MTTYPITHNTYIEVDTDTEVGYSFLVSKFYVTNKGTTTYRSTATKIKEVLDIVSPSTSSTITIDIIESFSTSLESIIGLYYTWEDTGAYVKTVQFNQYDKYPLTLDADKKKLYIMNTNVIFDLTLTERKEERCEYLIDYYQTHMGLNISSTQMVAIYDMFISFYKPYCYNEIDSETLDTTLKYNNTFSLSNFRETSVAEYTCEVNPEENYTSSNIGAVLSLTSGSNKVTLTASLPSSITVGSTIEISGTTITETSYTYTSDGTYTVKSIDNSGNSFIVEEQIPNSFNAPELYLKSSIMTISSIDRDSSIITLSADVPSSIQVGDIIYVEGTQQAVEGETVTCDGKYTVGAISGSTVTVQETLNTNFSGSDATIYKKVLKGQIVAINGPNKTISLVSAPSSLVSGNKVIVSYLGNESTYTVDSVTNNVITTTETPTTLTYPVISIPVASTEILITVEESKDETTLPVGEFMVDNFNQCKSYLGTYSGLEIPKDANYSAVNEYVPTTMSVTGVSVTMQLKGVYSRIYSE